jgi:hypothetical protein
LIHPLTVDQHSPPQRVIVALYVPTHPTAADPVIAEQGVDTTTTSPYMYDGMGMGKEGEQGVDFAAREGGQVQAKQVQLHSRSHRDHHHADHGRATVVVAAMVVVGGGGR